MPKHLNNMVVPQYPGFNEVVRECLLHIARMERGTGNRPQRSLFPRIWPRQDSPVSHVVWHLSRAGTGPCLTELIACLHLLGLGVSSAAGCEAVGWNGASWLSLPNSCNAKEMEVKHYHISK